jgi:hypothetical protein
LRFAVRRPATRPASPCGHRPPGDALPVLWAGHPALLAGGVRPAEGADVAASGPVTDRRSLARLLLGPAEPDHPDPSALTEILLPARVTCGRPAEETVHRLGETTERLLLGHLRDRRPTVTDFARRERRLPPGQPAGALTSRTR